MAAAFTGVEVRGGGNDGVVVPPPVDGQPARNREVMAVTTMCPDRRGVAREGLDVRRAGEVPRKFGHGDVRPATRSKNNDVRRWIDGSPGQLY